MSAGLTWQEAKTSAQKVESEIAGLIPDSAVTGIEQQKQGILLSCSDTEHNWNGATIVTLIPSAEIDRVIIKIGEHFSHSEYDVSFDRSVLGNLRVQLVAPNGQESYLVSSGYDPNTIRIASGSACFTLPEDVYPGGDF